LIDISHFHLKLKNEKVKFPFFRSHPFVFSRANEKTKGWERKKVGKVPSGQGAPPSQVTHIHVKDSALPLLPNQGEL
jgi:hypothetical protein